MKKIFIVLISMLFACSKEDTNVIPHPLQGGWLTYGYVMQNKDTGSFNMYLNIKEMNLGYFYNPSYSHVGDWNYINIPINKITNDSIFIQFTDTVFKSKSYYYKLENDSLNLPDLLLKKLRRIF